MSFEVIIDGLRSAGDKYESCVSEMVGYDFATVGVSGASFGHIELAAWFSAVADQCDNAGQALHDGAAGLAASLRAAANDYEATDNNVSNTWKDPLSQLYLPGGARP